MNVVSNRINDLASSAISNSHIHHNICATFTSKFDITKFYLQPLWKKFERAKWLNLPLAELVEVINSISDDLQQRFNFLGIAIEIIRRK